MKDKIVILHQTVSNNALPDEKDVLNAAESIRSILDNTAFEPEIVVADAHYDFIHSLQTIKPSLVFNLVETFNGTASAATIIPEILDSLKIPYTGNSARALYLTTDKMLTKQVLSIAGLPSPMAYTYPFFQNFIPGLYIFKPLREDASLGISDDCIQQVNSPEEALIHLNIFEKIFSMQFFLERFIRGRELNVSLVGGKGNPHAFHPAEIIFTGNVNPFRIVDYESKWIESSPRYQLSNRTFTFSETDRLLIQKLIHLSEESWKCAGLNGYARIDFRVDEDNNPWILELNANPCCSPDSGLVAAASNEGLSYKELILRIIKEATHEDQKRDPSL